MQQGGKMQHYLVNPLTAGRHTNTHTLAHMEYFCGPSLSPLIIKSNTIFTRHKVLIL